MIVSNIHSRKNGMLSFQVENIKLNDALGRYDMRYHKFSSNLDANGRVVLLSNESKKLLKEGGSYLFMGEPVRIEQKDRKKKDFYIFNVTAFEELVLKVGV